MLQTDARNSGSPQHCMEEHQACVEQPRTATTGSTPLKTGTFFEFPEFDDGSSTAIISAAGSETMTIFQKEKDKEKGRTVSQATPLEVGRSNECQVLRTFLHGMKRTLFIVKALV
ncbi:hypothetical protein EDB81DRAFT_767969 [Dactylonectria macrodidyma]|uniref:Uncharacterized protein n=1 Tax=Dactylonectria macrodidyma TaxID=307937 RepID=A0A9P9D6K9_9HYPO|nr:hypothetical protein EDB81DRAFT_767969 [Dactylonectria macrodidyma]